MPLSVRSKTSALEKTKTTSTTGPKKNQSVVGCTSGSTRSKKSITTPRGGGSDRKRNDNGKLEGKNLKRLANGNVKAKAPTRPGVQVKDCVRRTLRAISKVNLPRASSKEPKLIDFVPLVSISGSCERRAKMRLRKIPGSQSQERGSVELGSDSDMDYSPLVESSSSSSPESDPEELVDSSPLKKNKSSTSSKSNTQNYALRKKGSAASSSTAIRRRPKEKEKQQQQQQRKLISPLFQFHNDPEDESSSSESLPDIPPPTSGGLSKCSFPSKDKDKDNKEKELKLISKTVKTVEKISKQQFRSSSPNSASGSGTVTSEAIRTLRSFTSTPVGDSHHRGQSPSESSHVQLRSSTTAPSSQHGSVRRTPTKAHTPKKEADNHSVEKSHKPSSSGGTTSSISRIFSTLSQQSTSALSSSSVPLPTKDKEATDTTKPEKSSKYSLRHSHRKVPFAEMENPPFPIDDELEFEPQIGKGSSHSLGVAGPDAPIRKKPGRPRKDMTKTAQLESSSLPSLRTRRTTSNEDPMSLSFSSKPTEIRSKEDTVPSRGRGRPKRAKLSPSSTEAVEPMSKQHRDAIAERARQSKMIAKSRVLNKHKHKHAPWRRRKLAEKSKPSSYEVRRSSLPPLSAADEFEFREDAVNHEQDMYEGSTPPPIDAFTRDFNRKQQQTGVLAGKKRGRKPLGFSNRHVQMSTTSSGRPQSPEEDDDFANSASTIRYEAGMDEEIWDENNDNNPPPWVSGRSIKSDPLSSSPEKGFVCDVCEAEFTNKFEFSSHLWNHRAGSDFTCGECQQKFQNGDEYNGHIDIAHAPSSEDQNQVVFCCSVCPSKFSRQDYLEKHEVSHVRDPVSNKLICQVCDQRFATYSQLSRHIDLVHLNLTGRRRGFTAAGDKGQLKRQDGGNFDFRLYSVFPSLLKYREAPATPTSAQLDVSALQRSNKGRLPLMIDDEADGVVNDQPSAVGQMVRKTKKPLGVKRRGRPPLVRTPAVPTVVEIVVPELSPVDLELQLKEKKLFKAQKKAWLRDNSIIGCGITTRKLGGDVHGKPSPLRCKDCLRKFVSRKLLVKHVEYFTHAEHHLCPICRKGFKWKYLLARHMTRHKGLGNATVVVRREVRQQQLTTFSAKASKLKQRQKNLLLKKRRQQQKKLKLSSKPSTKSTSVNISKKRLSKLISGFPKKKKKGGQLQSPDKTTTTKLSVPLASEKPIASIKTKPKPISIQPEPIVVTSEPLTSPPPATSPVLKPSPELKLKQNRPQPPSSKRKSLSSTSESPSKAGPCPSKGGRPPAAAVPQPSTSARRISDVSEKRSSFEPQAWQGGTFHSCDMCPKLFTDLKTVSIHKLFHTNTNLFICQHPQCLARCERKSDFELHMKSHEKNKPYHLCYVCFKPFKWKKDMIRHVRRKHPDERTYRCTYCSDRFRTNDELTFHISQFHAKHREHRCKYCDRRYAQKRYLVLHLKQQHNVEDASSSIPYDDDDDDEVDDEEEMEMEPGNMSIPEEDEDVMEEECDFEDDFI